MLMSITLTACKTTEPVVENYTGPVIENYIEKFRQEKLVNLPDPNQCQGGGALDPLSRAEPILVDRGYLCVLTQDLTLEESLIVADFAEIAFQKVVHFLEIKNPRKITIIVRRDEVIGNGRAKAQYGRVIIPKRHFENKVDDGLLIHEITHALMGLSGPYVMRRESRYVGNQRHVTRHLGTSGLLNEGLAQYLQLKLANPSNLLKQKLALHAVVKRASRRLFKHHLLLSLHKNEEQFSGHGSNYKKRVRVTNYLFAGSFVKFLIEENGLDHFLPLYRGAEFTESYGKKLDGLQNDWIFFLHRERLVKRFPNGGNGKYQISKLSDALICRKMDISPRFAEEGDSRSLTTDKCNGLQVN